MSPIEDLKSPPKVVITGGSGLLALNWAAELSQYCDVVLVLNNRRIDVSFAKTKRLNISDTEDFEALIHHESADLVVHAAGLTDVETCQKKPELAEQVNVEIAGSVAQACARGGVKLVSISTDHLSDGKSRFHSENDPITPTNIYAQSKAKGETAVLTNCPDAIVIRTNFFGWGSSYKLSFSDIIIKSLRENTKVFLFSDVFYTPILIADLVRATMSLVQLDANGLFNLVGSERLSKHSFGKRLAAEFGLNSQLIVPSRIADRADLTSRPRDMSLAIDKAKNVLGVFRFDLQEGIRELARQENLMSYKEIRKL